MINWRDLICFRRAPYNTNRATSTIASPINTTHHRSRECRLGRIVCCTRVTVTWSITVVDRWKDSLTIDLCWRSWGVTSRVLIRFWGRPLRSRRYCCWESWKGRWSRGKVLRRSLLWWMNCFKGMSLRRTERLSSFEINQKSSRLKQTLTTACKSLKLSSQVTS